MTPNLDINPDATDVWYDGDLDRGRLGRFRQGWRRLARTGVRQAATAMTRTPRSTPTGSEIGDRFDDDMRRFRRRQGPRKQCRRRHQRQRRWRPRRIRPHGGVTSTRTDSTTSPIIGSYSYQSVAEERLDLRRRLRRRRRWAATIEDGQNYFNGDGWTDYLGYEVAFMSNITIDEGPHLAVGSPYANGYYGVRPLSWQRERMRSSVGIRPTLN